MIATIVPRSVALAVLVSGVTLAGAAEAPEVLAGFQGWLDGTRDLRGRFEQTLVSGALGEGLVESGTLRLKRPGRMRWDYLEPELKVALVEGDRTSLYVEEDEQLWKGRLGDDDSLLPTLLSGRRPLDELFAARLLATPEQGGAGSYRLRLAPRGASEELQQIVLTLRPPRYAIREVEVLDAAGNRMIYRFSDLKRNRGLADSEFYFEPPPGTEIILPPEP